MSPGDRCDEVIRLIDETLRDQQHSQASATQPERVDVARSIGSSFPRARHAEPRMIEP